MVKSRDSKQIHIRATVETLWHSVCTSFPYTPRSQYMLHIWLLKVIGRLTCFLSAAPVQVKELSFSFGIAAHDLTTKLKQVESWVEKKHHVRMTLRAGRGGPDVNLVRRSTHIFSIITCREEKKWLAIVSTLPYMPTHSFLCRNFKWGDTIWWVWIMQQNVLLQRYYKIDFIQVTYIFIWCHFIWCLLNAFAWFLTLWSILKPCTCIILNPNIWVFLKLCIPGELFAWLT